MHTFILAEIAAKELERELIYSERVWGKKHALTYSKELRKRFNILRRNPFLHPISEIHGGLRVFTHKGLKIFYAIEEKELITVYGVISVHKDASIMASRLKNRLT